MKAVKTLLLALALIFVFDSGVFALSTSAQAAIVINADTGEVLYEQNADEQLPMASTTKIMTALLLAEQDDLSKQVRCTKQMVTVEGSSMGLLEGDIVTYRDLLYGMLLASGNDAANTTAITLGGSLEGFADMMNRKALSLGLSSTHFVSPSGLDAEGHYTTAHDLARLAAYALRNQAFREACSSYTATLYYGNPPYRRTLTNHNRLLKSYEGLIGVKTGFTKKAGRCLVTAAKRGSATVVAVTLHDPNDWSDHRAMLDHGFSVLREQNFSNIAECRPVSVVGSDKTEIQTKTGDFLLSLKPENASKITADPILPDFLYAPVKEGDKIGEVVYSFDGQVVGKTDLLADGSADRLPEIKESFADKIKVNFLRILSKL